jgi:hypothetical protein
MLKCVNGRFAGYGWEIVQEFVKSLSALEIVEQYLERHARTAKHRSTKISGSRVITLFSAFTTQHP